jgi:hypothetical protein
MRKVRLVPQELLIQIFDDAAVVTFHIEKMGYCGDTLVLVKREGGRIVHLHASSVQVDG